MPILYTDFETRSTVDLRASGAWKYAAHATTTPLYVSYAIDDGEVRPGFRANRSLRHFWLPLLILPTGR